LRLSASPDGALWGGLPSGNGIGEQADSPDLQRAASAAWGKIK